MELVQSIKIFDANRYLILVIGLRIAKAKFEIRAQHPHQRINPKSKIQNPELRPEGFTLIEMLLAISIFSMVVAIIFSSFSVGLGSWEKGEKLLTLRLLKLLNFFKDTGNSFKLLITYEYYDYTITEVDMEEEPPEEEPPEDNGDELPTHLGKMVNAGSGRW